MLEIMFQGEDGKWHKLDENDILHMSVEHSALIYDWFKVPVIVKEDGHYIVNTIDSYQQYKAAGKPVTTFAEVLKDKMRLHRTLSDVGYLRPL